MSGATDALIIFDEGEGTETEITKHANTITDSYCTDPLAVWLKNVALVFSPIKTIYELRLNASGFPESRVSSF